MISTRYKQRAGLGSMQSDEGTALRRCARQQGCFSKGRTCIAAISASSTRRFFAVRSRAPNCRRAKLIGSPVLSLGPALNTCILDWQRCKVHNRGGEGAWEHTSSSSVSGAAASSFGPASMYKRSMTTTTADFPSDAHGICRRCSTYVSHIVNSNVKQSPSVAHTQTSPHRVFIKGMVSTFA